MKRGVFWSWLWVAIGIVYFFLPLVATFMFSLRAKLGMLSFRAYENVLKDPAFARNFSASVGWAVFTIIVGIVLFVPTAYWVRLRLPQARAAVEFVTLLPFVVPAIVFVFGLVRTYSHPPLLIVDSPALLVAGYTVLSMPYMYPRDRHGPAGDRRADADRGGAKLGSRVGDNPVPSYPSQYPGRHTERLFLSFAIVIGEFTLAQYLAKPAFGPYMAVVGQNLAYEPAALAVMSFALTWASIGIIQFVGRGAPGQAQIAGVK